MFCCVDFRHQYSKIQVFIILLINFDENYNDLRTETEIINLSDEKLRVAEFLLQNGFFDDAYYLGGYSFELCLKAKICKTLDIQDFFDFDNARSRRLPTSRNKSKDNLYKSFKVHDYEQLLIYILYFQKK